MALMNPVRNTLLDLAPVQAITTSLKRVVSGGHRGGLHKAGAITFLAVMLSGCAGVKIATVSTEDRSPAGPWNQRRYVGPGHRLGRGRQSEFEPAQLAQPLHLRQQLLWPIRLLDEDGEPVIEPATHRLLGVAARQEDALLADSVGVALMVVLDALRPSERLAFVLHDMFAVPFDEIGEIIGTSGDAAKMLTWRARRKVQASPRPTADRLQQRSVVDAFLAAASPPTGRWPSSPAWAPSAGPRQHASASPSNLSSSCTVPARA